MPHLSVAEAAVTPKGVARLARITRAIQAARVSRLLVIAHGGSRRRGRLQASPLATRPARRKRQWLVANMATDKHPDRGVR